MSQDRHMHENKHLDIQELVVGASGQQEALCRVGKLTVVDLFFMLLLKDSQLHGSLHIPHLKTHRHTVEVSNK